MNSNIFIPKKINVGFQNRSGTYTGKLAYIIYFDEIGKLRKEKSWSGWRDNDIPNEIFNNVPTEGFVINKHVGGYSSGWNHRNSYIRIYDPRNFEFEISVENLLYILENATSTKGKGLEGQFIYGWEGKDLVLIPCDSPDYKEMLKLNTLRHEHKTFKGAELIIGATYLGNNNQNLIYLGRYYENNSDRKESKAYFFYDLCQTYSKIKIIKTLNKEIIDIVDDKCIENYADLFEELKESSYYSERDMKKDKYVDYTLEEFEKRLEKNHYWGFDFFTENEDKKFQRLNIRRYRRYSYIYGNNKYYDVFNCEKGHIGNLKSSEKTISQIYEIYEPKYLTTYNSNGKLIKEWKE